MNQWVSLLTKTQGQLVLKKLEGEGEMLGGVKRLRRTSACISFLDSFICFSIYFTHFGIQY